MLHFTCEVRVSLPYVHVHVYSIKRNTAAQMWLLARILPLSIGYLVPEDDERWSNFLRMLDIVDILFCPQITEDDAAYLTTLIMNNFATSTQAGM